MNKLKYLQGAFFSCSKKDLNACTSILYDKLKSGDLEQVLKYFQNLKSKFQYIPYRKNLKGLSHHNKLGPSRRPVKCYSYIIETLKGMRGAFKNYTNSPKIKHVLINTSGKTMKGAIKASRGRRFPKDSLKHKLVLILESQI